MTRIIAGDAADTRLQVPGAGTRPTSERVREALFAALDARGYLDGARVLDLYAGTGALGLEALSRGAASATLVEAAQKAGRVLQQNAKAVAARGCPAARVVIDKAERFVAEPAGEFDLVFLDPPYDVDASLVLQALPALLAPDALVVLERAKRGDLPHLPDELEVEREKTYGDTTLVFLTVPGDEDAGGETGELDEFGDR